MLLAAPIPEPDLVGAAELDLRHHTEDCCGIAPSKTVKGGPHQEQTPVRRTSARSR